MKKLLVSEYELLQMRESVMPMRYKLKQAGFDLEKPIIRVDDPKSGGILYKQKEGN